MLVFCFQLMFFVNILELIVFHTLMFEEEQIDKMKMTVKLSTCDEEHIIYDVLKYVNDVIVSDNVYVNENQKL